MAHIFRMWSLIVTWSQHQVKNNSIAHATGHGGDMTLNKIGAMSGNTTVNSNYSNIYVSVSQDLHVLF